MRFLVDECTGPAVARWLRRQHHDVLSAYEQFRGADDDRILQRADAENRILITNDKDFGELIYRGRERHKGVILLRLEDERVDNKIAVLQRLLDLYADRLQDNFVVVTKSTVRFASRSRD